MRTITLLQNSKRRWYLHTTVGREVIHHNEDYDTPASGQRALITEGRNQPYAKLVVEVDGRKHVVRKAKPLPPAGPEEFIALEEARRVMRKR